jgi:hypothetical protein
MPHIAVYDDSMMASTDMRQKQFYPVKLAATKNFVTEITAAIDKVYGIVQDKPNVGVAARIAKIGRWSARVDGSGTAIAIGDPLGPNAAGTALVKKTTADFNICAVALDVCTILGGIIDVDLNCVLPAYVRAAAG